MSLKKRSSSEEGQKTTRHKPQIRVLHIANFADKISLLIPHAQEKIVKEISKWDHVIASPHRFGGTEFRLGKREIGHIHGDYQADIVFPMQVRNQLVAEKKAEPHHILPQSGWITFRFRKRR